MEKEVAYIMSERENAITNKDIGLYMKCISKDYRDNADTFDTIRQKMQKNFEIFDRIEFSTSNRTIYPNGLTVMIVQDYELVFFVSGERKYISGKERIFLLKENTGWKIIKGL